MKKLSSESRVSFSTIRRAEDAETDQTTTQANMLAIVSALEAAGIEFIQTDDGAPGIVIRTQAKD